MPWKSISFGVAIVLPPKVYLSLRVFNCKFRRIGLRLPTARSGVFLKPVDVGAV